jgi:hypothetical protein
MNADIPFHSIIPFHFITIHNCYETTTNYLQRPISLGRVRSESRLSGHTTPALLGLLKHVLRHRTAASALLSVTTTTTTTLGLRLRLRFRLRLRPLIRLLGNLQDLLERLIGVGLHRGLHVREPRVLTRTVVASSATTERGAFRLDFLGGGDGGSFFGHLKLNESNGLLLYYI